MLAPVRGPEEYVNIAAAFNANKYTDFDLI
jgi:hypothetical protein